MRTQVWCLFAFLLLSIPVSTAINAGLFDIAEYRRVSYDATIGDDFLWFAPDLDITKVSESNIDEWEERLLEKIPKETEPNYMFLTSKGGQKFACALPNVDELTKATKPRSSKNPKIYGDALAASFYVNKCIRLRGNNWWAYTLCRGQTVEQVHGEEGQADYAKNILGLFDGNYVMPPYHESTDDRLLYVEESYTSGTFCDLSEFREPRKTSVRYECDAQLSTNEAYIQSVVEVRPCEYLMTVKVGTLCHFPEFLPVSQANSRKVGCQPYLSKKEVRRLLERAVDERNKKENFEKEARLARINYRMAATRFAAMTKGRRELYIPDLWNQIDAEMDYQAAHFNLMVINLKSDGEKITKKTEDSIWSLMQSTDLTNYLLYVEYETIADELRGNVWYYFQDTTWPKQQFPKSPVSVAVQNKYIKILEKNIKYDSKYNFQLNEGRYQDSLKTFLATGIIDVKFNLAISAMDIYHNMLDHLIGVNIESEEFEWIDNVYTKIRDRETVNKLVAHYYQSDNMVHPMRNISISVMDDFFQEIDEHLKSISKNGDYHEELKIADAPRNIVYDSVTAKPAPREMKKRGFDYQLSVANETDFVWQTTFIYTALLSPVYQLFSIGYFQREYKSQYFHARPPLDKTEWNMENVDWMHHMNMATDLLRFARMLSGGTIMKVRHAIKVQKGEVDSEFSVRQYLKNWPKIEKELFKTPRDDYYDIEKTYFEAFEYFGPLAVEGARRRLWNEKVESWKIDYLMKDYKLRKEAHALHKLMTDMLAVKDGNDIISTVGVSSGTKNQKGSEEGKMFQKLQSILDIAIDELEDLIGVKDEKLFDDLKESADDKEFFRMDDMKEVLDLLDKAGLSKNSKVEIKVFDTDGEELKANELDPEAQSVFLDLEPMTRFRDLEKAYSASWNQEEEEDGEGETM